MNCRKHYALRIINVDTKQKTTEQVACHWNGLLEAVSQIVKKKRNKEYSNYRKYGIGKTVLE
jgi:hypothetical protein